MPGSILHPAAIGRTAGKVWPIYADQRNLLLNVLPYLINVYHCIAYWNNRNHDNGEMGRIIDEFMHTQVSRLFSMKSLQFLKLKPTPEDQEELYEHDIGLQAVLDNQKGAQDWLKKIRYNITNLKLRDNVTTTDILNCHVCKYRNF